jgi:2-polyprenyl-3-methyl-5-hydroxy-6-metoxy-1,4-benzoquinol methylase
MDREKKPEAIQLDYWAYTSLKRETQKKVKVRKILISYQKWFEKNFNMKGKSVLDIGCLIESEIYKKFVRDNASSNGYYGFDIDREAVNWLHGFDAYYDIYSAREYLEFDYIFLVDVYEHLAPDERIEILGICNHLLTESGRLYVAMPYTKNLNYLVNFVDDWTHKLVDLEGEVAAFMAFGNFEFDKIEVYLGGWTMPYRKARQNVAGIIRNLICLFPPFYVGIIVARK